ncbi:MAG: tripartite tricarboxylate transporter substrate-binding protein, partial [Pseudomonadota bacterium]
PQIKAGKLRALAGWGDKRLPVLPDLPTFKELGYKDVEFYIWSGVFVPAATPADVQKALREAVKQAVASDEFKSAMAKLETPIAYLDAPEFKTFWDKDAAMLAGAVKRVGRIEEKQ